MIMARTSAPRESHARFMSGLIEQSSDEDSRMHGGFASEVGDVMTATGAGGDDHGARRLVAHGREKPAFANRARDVVMLAGIAERTGHAAAAGVEIDDRRVRDRRQQRLRGRDERHRLLMTVAVEQDGVRAGLQRKLCASRCDELFEQYGAPGDDFSAPARFSTQQCWNIFANRRETTRLAEDQRPPGIGVYEEQVGVPRGHGPRIAEQTLRNLRPSAAAIWRKRWS